MYTKIPIHVIFDFGQINSHSPLGPDEHGYYIYDNDDINLNPTGSSSNSPTSPLPYYMKGRKKALLITKMRNYFGDNYADRHGGLDWIWVVQTDSPLAATNIFEGCIGVYSTGNDNTDALLSGSQRYSWVKSTTPGNQTPIITPVRTGSNLMKSAYRGVHARWMRDLTDSLWFKYHFGIINEFPLVSHYAAADGDILGALYVSDPKYNVDMFMGIGGGPEGVLAASALDTFDCHFQGRFIFENKKDIKEANSMGIIDLNKKYELNEIIKGDSIFCATGITSNDIIKGIIIDHDKFISETLVTHKNSNYKQLIKNVNSINE